MWPAEGTRPGGCTIDMCQRAGCVQLKPGVARRKLTQALGRTQLWKYVVWCVELVANVAYAAVVRFSKYT